MVFRSVMRKLPHQTREFFWTSHALAKMRQYGLSEQKVRGVIFRPNRKEEGIAPKTVAVMQKAGSARRPYEIWVMYQIVRNTHSAERHSSRPASEIHLRGVQRKIISAWKYPGISPKRHPMPEHVLNELLDIL